MSQADKLVAELAGAGVATVYEAAGRHGLIEHDWVTLTAGRRIAGYARTVLCGPGDNRAVHEAMARVQPGDVLVITMEDPVAVAVVGDLLATQAVAHGAVGLLVDAAVRDVSELAEMPLAIHARWRNARGATKVHRGAVDVPVIVGGSTVAPGDVVVLDDDGAAVVPAADVDVVLAAVRARLAREKVLRARWSNGELSYDAYGLRAEDEADRLGDHDRHIEGGQTS